MRSEYRYNLQRTLRDRTKKDQVKRASNSIFHGLLLKIFVELPRKRHLAAVLKKPLDNRPSKGKLYV